MDIYKIYGRLNVKAALAVLTKVKAQNHVLYKCTTINNINNTYEIPTFICVLN